MPSVASGISGETDSSIVPEAEITGGSGGEAVVAVKGENKEEKATSEPKVIVAGCKEIPEHIYAGDSVQAPVLPTALSFLSVPDMHHFSCHFSVLTQILSEILLSSDRYH